MKLLEMFLNAHSHSRLQFRLALPAYPDHLFYCSLIISTTLGNNFFTFIMPAEEEQHPPRRPRPQPSARIKRTTSARKKPRQPLPRPTNPPTPPQNSRIATDQKVSLPPMAIRPPQTRKPRPNSHSPRLRLLRKLPLNRRLTKNSTCS